MCTKKLRSIEGLVNQLLLEETKEEDWEDVEEGEEVYIIEGQEITRSDLENYL